MDSTILKAFEETNEETVNKGSSPVYKLKRKYSLKQLSETKVRNEKKEYKQVMKSRDIAIENIQQIIIEMKDKHEEDLEKLEIQIDNIKIEHKKETELLIKIIKDDSDKYEQMVKKNKDDINELKNNIKEKEEEIDEMRQNIFDNDIRIKRQVKANEVKWSEQK